MGLVPCCLLLSETFVQAAVAAPLQARMPRALEARPRRTICGQ